MSATAPSRVDSGFGDLPYEGPVLDLLGPLHRGFDVVNRWFVVPALRAGLGPLFSTPATGSLMLLRTTGRRSGRVREVPLGYVVCDGAVYCCAGFGRHTAWYRNLQADPRVEIVLPVGAVAGRAETVVDVAEWARVFPAYLRALGLVGRATIGDLRDATPERLDRLRTELPLVRIRPTGIAAGPADPFGAGWIVMQAVAWFGLIALVRAIVRRLRRGS